MRMHAHTHRHTHSNKLLFFLAVSLSHPNPFRNVRRPPWGWWKKIVHLKRQMQTHQTFIFYFSFFLLFHQIILPTHSFSSLERFGRPVKRLIQQRVEPTHSAFSVKGSEVPPANLTWLYFRRTSWRKPQQTFQVHLVLRQQHLSQPYSWTIKPIWIQCSCFSLGLGFVCPHPTWTKQSDSGTERRNHRCCYWHWRFFY